MSKLKFMGSIFCVCLLSYSQLLAFSEINEIKNKEGKLYLDRSDVVVANNGVFVVLNGILTQAETVHSDNNGVYVMIDDVHLMEVAHCDNCRTNIAGSRGERCPRCGSILR